MASYLDRLVIRGRAGAVAAPRSVTAPRSIPSAPETEDPFEAEPILEPAPAPPRSVERVREVRDREHLVVRERETVLRAPPASTAVSRDARSEARRATERVVAELVRPMSEPHVPAPPPRVARSIAPATVVAPAGPERVVERERVREIVEAHTPAVAPPAPVIAQLEPRAPIAQMLAAPVQAPPEVAPAPPRLSIGRVVVEVVPRSAPPTPPPSVHATVVVRSPVVAQGSILHRGFGLGQS